MSPFKDPEKRKEYERKRYLENKNEYNRKHREYREKNKEKLKEYYKEYNKKYREKLSAYHKEWWEKNKQKVNEKRKNKYNTDSKYREELKEKSKQFSKTYSYKKKRRENDFKRRRSDIQWKLSQVLRVRLNKAIRNNQKVGSAVHDLGCTIEELKIHLENQFEEGMTWDNWKHDGWHIDHKKPLSKFDLTDPEQLKEACHYTNLQPLWWYDNIEKSDKID
jgi:hypothetical protein